MNRFSRIAILTLALSFIATGIASATTYYIAANGSDSNNGTSNTTPWAHAPGMPNCTGACASTNPAAGDQFIFRGGDTWHYGNSSATPYIGSGGWNWKWGGTSGSPIYIGVDESWYSGGSWVRPILNGDNPLSAAFVSNCSYDQGASNAFTFNSVSYVTLDNFEWTGRCWASNSNGMSAPIFQNKSCSVIVSNSYFHGWTASIGSVENEVGILGNVNGSCGLATHNQYYGNVFDGSDSSGKSICGQGYEPSMPCHSGIAIYGEGYDVHGNVFRYMSCFAVVVNLYTWHDNLTEYLYTTYQPNGQHSNVVNNDVGGVESTLLFYNNIVRHTYVTELIYLYLASSGKGYVFNNVFYDNLKYDTGGDTAPDNCIIVESNGGTNAFYFYNNTLDMDTDDATGGGCIISFTGTSWNPAPFVGTYYAENNHFIGYNNLAATWTIPSYASGGVSVTATNNGGNVFEATSTARGQGYTQANNDATQSSSGQTVGAGNNVTTSCSTFSSNSSLCSGTSLGAAEQSRSGGEIANSPAIPLNPRGASGSCTQGVPGCWDAGAYEFSAGTGTTVQPPTGLAAVVQ